MSENVPLFIAPRFVLLYLLDADIFFRQILKKGVVLFSKSVLFLSVNLRLNKKFYLTKPKILLIQRKQRSGKLTNNDVGLAGKFVLDFTGVNLTIHHAFCCQLEVEF